MGSCGCDEKDGAAVMGGPAAGRWLMRQTDDAEIGKRMGQLRRTRTKLTQAQMAQKCEVTKNHISCIERGIYIPGVNIVMVYSRETGVSMEEIMGIQKSSPAVLPELTEILEKLDSGEQAEVLGMVKEKYPYG